MTNSEKPVRKPRLWLRILVVLVIGIAIAAGLGYKKYLQIGEMMAEGSIPPPPISVTVASVQAAQWQDRIKAIGTLVASQGVDLSSEVAGIIESINFESGQDIAKGDLLFELNNQSELATLGSARATFASENSQYQRLLQLKGQSFAAKNDIDIQAALVDIARAQITVAEVALLKTKIHAPFAGRLGIRLVDIGQYISPGEALVTLQAVDHLFLDFTLPESNFKDLAVGQPVNFTVRSYPGQTFSATIKAWNPVLDENTRNVAIRAEIDNRQHQLAPGMFAEMEVTSAHKIAVMTLPETAIFYNIYGEAVYVLEQQPESTAQAPDYRLAARQVRVAYRDNGEVGIISGVKPGDLAVTSGQLKLYPSLRVAIVDDPPEYKAANKAVE